MSLSPSILDPVQDPFASALSYTTAPYEQGAATQNLVLEPAVSGVSAFAGYTFSVFQSKYGVQTSSLNVSFLITLIAPLGENPVTLEVDYVTDSGPANAQLVIPAGTLPGTSFPIPVVGDVAVLQTLLERAAPAAGSPSGPDKWQVTALLGNTARMLALLLGERQVIGAVAKDILDQRHLLTARGWSLDLTGDALGVPRLLPSPYRLDLDASVLALYHLDDIIGPVVDATGDNPAVSYGAQRGVPGKIGNAAQVTSAGGIAIPDDPAFAVSAGGSFTVEMFAQLPALGALTTFILACKQPHVGDTTTAGWALTVQTDESSNSTVHFSVTDRTGSLAQAVSASVAVSAWFHVAAVLDGSNLLASIFIDGVLSGSSPFAALAEIQNCADIGLGADRTGAPQAIATLLDEVRFSNLARTDFTAVVAGAPYAPDANTIALYHLDETDDLIDEATAQYFGLNHGATRGVQARFNGGALFTGDPLPHPECPYEAAFQQQLRQDTWDRTQGGAKVVTGPYTRFGYRQGAISLPGLTAAAQPVFINDSVALNTTTLGEVTTACYGFAPTDLGETISNLQAAGRSAQEAIDYFGAWNGSPDSFFAAQYAANGITATHEACAYTPGTPSWMQIPGQPAFAFDANTSFTVEAFIRPDNITDDYPRAIVASRSSGLRDGEANANEAGWALLICGCGCIANNLQWTVGDAAGKLVTIVANMNLSDGSFHHVAGVLDRDAGTTLLFVDGAEVSKATIGALGAAGSSGDVILGNDPALDAPYAGLIDEVRLSTTARRIFNPVLGESDDRYRQRLAIFAPWRLPSSITLQRGVSALSLPTLTTVEEVAAEATTLLLSSGAPSPSGQLTVLETDSTRFCASRQFRILPARLNPGDSISASGTIPADESDATGDYTFHMEALLRHDDASGLSFPTEDARWMILRAAQGLEALATAVTALSADTQIVVDVAFSPVTALHAQGRSLDISIASPGPGIDLSLIAAMSHEIGVDYVAYDISATFVRLSFASGSDLDLSVPVIVAPGTAVEITIARPAIANPSQLTYRVVPCGTADGTLSSDSGDNATGQIFTGTGLGQVTLVAQYQLSDGSSLTGARTITLAPDTLDGCTVIDSAGDLDATELSASGAPDPDFQEAYLVVSDLAHVTYASVAAQRMQLPLEKALAQLVALAAAEPGAPQITVLAAYDPAATTLQSVGRGLIVGPSDTTLTAARLGALAFRSGFSYIERRRYPPSVYASVSPGPRFEIINSPLKRLWQNARISGLGEFMATEFAAAGAPDPGFTVAQLQTYSNPGVTFADGVSNQVQATLATALDNLVSALASDGVAGNPQIFTSFNPAATDLTSVGRGVLMNHPTVPADRLSGYALAAGFGFVQHQVVPVVGHAVYAAAYPANGAPKNFLGSDDLILNVLTELSVRPELSIAGNLDWCTVLCCGAQASLITALPDSVTSPLFSHKLLSGSACGTVTIDASFSLDDAARPYQFLVTSALGDGALPKLTKDQYDDLLNFVDAYCPVGVEAVTRGIRDLVHGFSRPPGWSQLATRATFPGYRANRS